jgi:thiol-disulfide isomerase/thioredoxin
MVTRPWLVGPVVFWAVLSQVAPRVAAQPEPDASRPEFLDPRYEPAALRVLEQLVKRYQKLEAYSDQGKLYLNSEINGKPFRESTEMRVAFTRPDKLMLSCGTTRFFCDGRSGVSVLDSSRAYLTGESLPKNWRMSFEFIARFPAAASILSGINGVPAGILLFLLNSDNPRGAILAETDGVRLEKAPVGSQAAGRSLLIDQHQGPDIRLFIDEKTGLLTEIRMVLDPSRLFPKASKSFVVNSATFGWTSGPVSEVPVNPSVFAFKPPEKYEKVASWQNALGLVGQHSSIMNKPANDFTLAVLDRPNKIRKLRLEELKGKAVIIVFWASWSPPCFDQLAWVKRELADKYRDRGVVMLSVNIDDEVAEPDAARRRIVRILEEKNLKLDDAPLSYVALDPLNTVGQELRLNSIPATLILGRDHYVRFLFTGFKKSNTEPSIERLAKVLELPDRSLTGISPSADEDHSGNLRVPRYAVYPRGRNLSQSYAQATAGNGLQQFSASPGSISPAASMNMLYQQSAIRKLSARECLLLPQSTIQIRLGTSQSGLVGGPQIIHKFGYSLQYKDVPLSRHTSQGLVIASRGTQRNVLFSRERNLPSPDKLPMSTNPTVTQDDALKLGRTDAQQALGEGVALAPSKAGEVPQLEIVVGDGGTGELAWTYVIRANDRKDRFARQYWVAAQGDARILLKEDLVYLCGDQPPGPAAATAAKGRIAGNIWGFKKSPMDASEKNMPLQDYVANIVNSTHVLTDSSGQFTPVPGQANTALIGPFAVIKDAGGTLSPKPDGNNLLFDATTEAELAQVSAFYWVNFAHEFVKPFLPGTLTRLANNEVHVNINDTCNAFWNSDDNTLNFFKSGGGCVNSAYCDVACHEFGHGVDAEFGDILDAPYSEGFGDSLAILITHDSIIGRDFLGKDKHLRNAADPIQWPQVKDDFDPHAAGQPYACFTWDLTQSLKTKFGNDEKKAFDTVKELTLGAAALNPRDVPDAVRLVFFVDHQNGSKYFQEMAQAADLHQIPRPSTPADLDNPANLNVVAR